MVAHARKSRVLRLLIVLAAVGALVGGGYVAHKLRKRAAVEASLGKGQSAYEAGRYSEAAGELGRYLTAHRDNLDVLMQYADAQLQRRPHAKGALEQAFAAMESVLRQNPAHPKAGEKLTALYIAVNSPIEAERAARTWLAGDPGNAVAKRQLAVALGLQRKTGEALELIRQALAERPDDPRAPDILTRLIMLDGRDGTATQPTAAQPTATQPMAGEPGAAQSAASDADTDADAARRPVTDAEAFLQRLAQCKRELEDLATRHPQAPGIRLAMARFYRMYPDPGRTPEQQHALALEHLERAEKAPGVSAELLVEIAQMYADMGLFDRSAAAFDQAEALAPRNMDIYLARGQEALNTEDYADGVSIAERASKAPTGERRLDILPLAGECYARTGKIDEARRCIEELKASNAESDLLVYLEALIDAAEGRLSEALAGFEQAVRRNPRSSRAQLAFARALVTTGEPARAVAPLQEHVRLEHARGNTTNLGDLELAELYARLGRWDDALMQAERAQQHATGTWLFPRTFLARLEIQARIARPNGPRPNPALLAQLQEQMTRVLRNPAAAQVGQLQTLTARITAWAGDVDQAVAAIKQAREAASEKAELTRVLVEVLAEARRYDEAIEECRQAATGATPEQAALFESMLADVQLARGEPEEALAALTRAAEQSSGEQRSRLRVGAAELLIRLRRLPQAVELLQQICREEPANLRARQLLLGLPDSDEVKLDRQAIVAQIKQIEGEAGLNWRFWQALLWLSSDQWQSHKADIEKLLKDCILSNASWFEAMSALIALHERESATQAIASAQEMIARPELDETTRHKLRIRLIEVASRAELWAQADAALSALPTRLADPELERALESHRLAQAIRQGNSGQARGLLEERIQDPADWRSRLLLAGLLYREGRGTPEIVQRAFALIDEAAKAAPDTPEVLSARLNLLVGESRFDEAIAACNAAVEAGKQPEAVLLRARVWEARGEQSRADADFQRYATLEGHAEAGHLALGRYYFRHGRLEEAGRAWRQGLTLAPRSVEMRGALVEILLASGRPQDREEALQLIEQRLAEKADDDAFRMLRADSLLVSNPDEAAAIYEQVSRSSPTADKAFAKLAELQWTRNQQTEAAATIDRGLVGSPRSVPLLLMKARLVMARSPIEATAFAREAARLRPEDEEATATLAEALNQSGAGAEAIQTLSGFIQSPAGKDAFLARLNLARLLVQARRLDGVEALLAQADELRPSSGATGLIRILLCGARKNGPELIATADAHLKQFPDDLGAAQAAGAQLLELQDDESRAQAVRFFEHIVARLPDSAQAEGELGLAYYRTGDMAKARTRLESAYAKDRSNLSILNNLTWIVCEDQKDPAGAEKLAGPAIRDGADYPHLWDTWGMVQYRLGRLPEAVAAYEKALNHPRVEPDTRHSAMFHLARALAESDRTRSLDLLDRLLAISPETLTLSAADKTEAQALRERLRSAPAAGGPGT